MIPRIPGTPRPPMRKSASLRPSLHERSPLGAPLLEKILGLGEDTWKPLPEHSPGVVDRYGNFRPIESRPGANVEAPLKPGYQRAYAYDRTIGSAIPTSQTEARDDFRPGRPADGLRPL